MRRIIFIIFSLCTSAPNGIFKASAQNASITGKIISGQQPVEYANVTINTPDTTFVTGSVTDTNGTFSFQHLPAGKYLLKVACMGYRTAYHPFHNSPAGTHLENIEVQPVAITLNEVVVKAPLIKREADRFIMDVANSPAALGKDGAELLQQAPGVWITDDKIAINGSSGAKVLINERELRMSKEQLINYLRDLKSEDIQRIDVIPQAGAEYDANTSAGIIKINLKRQRNDGMSGNASLRTRHNSLRTEYHTSEDIRYHNGKLTLNAGFSGNLKPKDKALIDEMNLSSATRYESSSRMDGDSHSIKGKLGGIYEFTPRHSIGMELEYSQNKENLSSLNKSQLYTHENERLNEGTRLPNNQNKNFSATFNYIQLLDEKGSTFKVLGDYNMNRDNNRTEGRTILRLNQVENDSVFHEFTDTDYRVSALTLALEKCFHPNLTLKAGGKYTLNNMKNQALYEYKHDAQWLLSEEYCFDIRYKENIAAMYGILSAKAGRWGITGGLRAEYTYASGEGGYIKQAYMSWFPNLNVSFMADSKGRFMLIGQYSRSIRRPSFWDLNPTRLQVSDYTYQSGNPNLLPAYKNQVSATFVYAQKYTLTLSAEFTKDHIQQYVTTLPDAPDVSYINQMNFNDMKQYVAALHMPFELTGWWNWQNNITLIRNGDKLNNESPQEFHNLFIYNTNSTFTLPGKFYLDFSYSYTSKVQMSNFSVAPNQRVTIRLKKKFCSDKLTASIGIKNLFNKQTDMNVKTEYYERLYKMNNGWQKPSFECRLSYSFQTGKSFKSRKIESGADDERGRMSKGSEE